MSLNSPQYGGKTLNQLREETYSDVQVLFSYALKGGTAGIYMDDNLSTYFISDQLLQEFGLTYDEFMEKFHGGFLETICPQERDSYLSNIKSAFENDSIFDFITRVLINDQYSFWVGDVGKLLNKEEGIFLILRNDVSGMIQSQQELLHTANTYAKKSQELEAQGKETDIFEFEHRIVKRLGEIIWILVRGRFSDPSDPSLFNAVVIDITARKKVEEEARINEKRFRIAFAHTDRSIFEYDIQKRLMIHGDCSAQHYGLQQYTENVPDSLVECGLIHPDTVSVFLEMYDRIRAGDVSASCNIKARLTDGSYAWRRITLTTIFDENSAPIQAIGILEDIDEQVKREEELIYQSERDPLTGPIIAGQHFRALKTLSNLIL